MASFLSGAMPSDRTSQPDSAINADSVYEFESWICPGKSRSSTGVNSSPLESKATRGFRYMERFATPSIASKPISCARKRVPANNILRPTFMSMPRLRIFSPVWMFLNTLTVCGASVPAFRLLKSVSSTMTTASAPSGIGAPVMMRAACPRESDVRGISGWDIGDHAQSQGRCGCCIRNIVRDDGEAIHG